MTIEAYFKDIEDRASSYQIDAMTGYQLSKVDIPTLIKMLRKCMEQRNLLAVEIAALPYEVIIKSDEKLLDIVGVEK